MNRKNASTSKLAKVGKLLDARRLDEALTLCNEVLLAEPELYEAHNERVYILDALGRRDDALLELEKLVELRSDSPNSYFQRALWAIEKGCFLESLDDLGRVIDTGEEYFFESAHFFRAVALLSLGRQVDAMKDCMKLSPDYSMHVSSPGRIRGVLNRDKLIALASAA